MVYAKCRHFKKLLILANIKIKFIKIDASGIIYHHVQEIDATLR